MQDHCFLMNQVLVGSADSIQIFFISSSHRYMYSPSPRRIVKSPRCILTSDCITASLRLLVYSHFFLLAPPRPSALLGFTKVLQCAWESCSPVVQRFVLSLQIAGKEGLEVFIPKKVRGPPSLGAALLYNHVYGKQTRSAAPLAHKHDGELQQNH